MEVLGDEYYGARKHSNPPPFLLKTYMLVEDPSTDDVISWNTNGTAFVIWQPAEFARDLLPTLFKHNNFSSFIRQLNTYGFRKVATSRWEFCNDVFQKGKRDHLSHIRRRKSWANRPHPTAASPPPPATTSEVETDLPRSSSMSSSSTSEKQMINIINLADENKRLKRENGMLTSELSGMKTKCKELLDLLAAYTTSEAVLPAVRTCTKGEEDVDRRVKLFGVRLDHVKGEYDDDDDDEQACRERKRRFINLPNSCKY